MSAQTIIHPSITSIKKEAEDTIIKNAEKFIFKELYALGEGYCTSQVENAIFIYNITGSDNCELNRLIEEDIEKIEESNCNK